MKPKEKEITFIVWHDGDRSVGIPGNGCDITIKLNESEDEWNEMEPEEQKGSIDFLKGRLQSMMTDYYDFRCYVMTKEEEQDIMNEEE